MANSSESIEAADISLERDEFLRRMLRELTGTLEDIVGTENASGYINTVGSILGEWIDRQYRSNLEIEKLDLEQVARVCVDLKRRIGGDFYIVSVDDSKIVIGNRKCPFGDMAHDRPSLCMVTSNVFGRIAADNLGYARVALDETIARGHSQCRVTIHLQPKPESTAEEREYYSVEDHPNSPKSSEGQ